MNLKHNFIQNLDEFDTYLADLAWKLWSTLGVRGESVQVQDCCIDLEMLLVLSATVEKKDPRLFEEVLDWCAKYHTFVSVSRLKALLSVFDDEVKGAFSRFAQALHSVSTAKWPVYSKENERSLILSKKSHLADLKTPALLQLRLRALFGIGARADLLTFLVAKSPQAFTASEVSEVGYTKRALADTLDSFVQAGIVTCLQERNQKKYQLLKREALVSLVGELPTKFPDWRSSCFVVLSLRSVFVKHASSSLSSLVIALRNALPLLEPSFIKLGISIPPLSSDMVHWEDFVRAVLRDMRAILDRSIAHEPKSATTEVEMNFALIMNALYQVDDCIDGVNSIVDSTMKEVQRHQMIFKECYQMFACYLADLQEKMLSLMKFPVYVFNDRALSEMLYSYAQTGVASLNEFSAKIPLATEIQTASQASQVYQKSIAEMHAVSRFIYEIKERLKELYFYKTNVHLLTLSNKLSKRHPVLELFSGRKSFGREEA